MQTANQTAAAPAVRTSAGSERPATPNQKRLIHQKSPDAYVIEAFAQPPMTRERRTYQHQPTPNIPGPQVSFMAPAAGAVLVTPYAFSLAAGPAQAPGAQTAKGSGAVGGEPLHTVPKAAPNGLVSSALNAPAAGCPGATQTKRVSFAGNLFANVFDPRTESLAYQ